MKVNWAQGFLSLFVIYHLSAVALTPLLMPPHGEKISRWLTPYTATFEFTNLWEFFAPNPAAPMLLVWEREDPHGLLIDQGVWPREPLPGPVSDVEMREVAALYFMSAMDGSIEKMFVPWLCSGSEGADSVRVWIEARPASPPSGQTKNGAIRPDRRLVTHSFCRREGQGA